MSKSYFYLVRETHDANTAFIKYHEDGIQANALRIWLKEQILQSVQQQEKPVAS